MVILKSLLFPLMLFPLLTSRGEVSEFAFQKVAGPKAVLLAVQYAATLIAPSSAANEVMTFHVERRVPQTSHTHIRHTSAA